MDKISLSEVSSEFSRKFMSGLIEELEQAYPDVHPRTRLDDYEQGYRAGALDVIRRIKEASQ